MLPDIHTPRLCGTTALRIRLASGEHRPDGGPTEKAAHSGALDTLLTITVVSQEENSARESQEEITGIRRPEESETFSWGMWKVPHILKKDWREPSYYLDLADPEILCLVKYKQKTKFALPPIQMPFRKWWKPYLRCLSAHF